MASFNAVEFWHGLSCRRQKPPPGSAQCSKAPTAPPIPQASLLTADAGGRITAAIVTTERALGNDGPRTAFIAELVTHPDHRRRGLAEELLSHAMQALHDTGYGTLAVTVTSANAAAIALYLSRDFRRFAHPEMD